MVINLRVGAGFMGLVLLIVVRTFRLLNVPTKHGQNSADSLEVVEQG